MGRLDRPLGLRLKGGVGTDRSERLRPRTIPTGVLAVATTWEEDSLLGDPVDIMNLLNEFQAYALR